MYLPKLRMALVRCRTRPTGGGAINILGVLHTVLPRPRPLPRPWCFDDLVTEDVIRRATLRYVDQVNSGLRIYTYTHGFLSLMAFRDALIEAAFEVWLEATGATEDRDGVYVRSIYHHNAWHSEACAILKRHITSPRRAQRLHRRFGELLLTVLQNATCKKDIYRYLREVALPEFTTPVPKEFVSLTRELIRVRAQLTLGPCTSALESRERELDRSLLMATRNHSDPDVYRWRLWCHAQGGARLDQFWHGIITNLACNLGGA